MLAICGVALAALHLFRPDILPAPVALRRSVTNPPPPTIYIATRCVSAPSSIPTANTSLAAEIVLPLFLLATSIAFILPFFLLVARFSSRPSQKIALPPLSSTSTLVEEFENPSDPAGRPYLEFRVPGGESRIGGGHWSPTPRGRINHVLSTTPRRWRHGSFNQICSPCGESPRKPCPKRKGLVDVFGPLEPLFKPPSGDTNTPERRETQGSLEILNTPDRILQELLESREQAPLRSIKDMMAFGRVTIEEATLPCLETELSAPEREEICLRKIKELEFDRSCLRSEIKDLHEAVEGYALELAECRDESRKQSLLVEKLQNLVSEYSEKLRSTRSELFESQRGNTAEVREWGEQVRALETEVMRAKNSLKSALEMVEDRQSRIDELVAELEECSPRAKILDIHLGDANGEIRQLQEDLRDASGKLEGLQRDSQEYEMKCEREIAKLEYDVEMERSDHKSTRKRLQKLLDSAHSELYKVRGELQRERYGKGEWYGE